jgi:DNA polymerase III subunit gamma/tau
VSLALYRTYRPGRLADVIGQEHVTVPLARAIDTGRAHHAYLFTGPRGCGKTSTARILARSLNCEQGPTSDPCGVCSSCIDLAPNGPGSLDVVEMDAASHRGIDDARELREKAMYAPAASRYKVYIIDEAHQLTVDAANALLKLIEEPPPHLRFVFATTEPDKILATIRSRTHHYPYRLVSARRLQEHLAWICEQEGVPAEPEALGLVARAGAGSVRDALSILGQLVAGTGPEGLTYADAVAQLGVTDATMLDEVVDALAAGDGAQMFSVVDRVVEAGLDPRRFAADLLERLRDLVVLHEVPDAVEAGLLDAPDSQIETMRRQNEHLGLAQLSRAADLVSTGLSELKGATAPRLQLELLCARLLLPAIDDTDSGLLARLDRLEHRIAYLGDAAPAAALTPRQAARPAAPAAAPAAPATVEEAPAAAPAAPFAPATPSAPVTGSAPPARPAPTAAAPGGPPAPPRLSTVAPTTAPGAAPTTAEAPASSAPATQAPEAPAAPAAPAAAAAPREAPSAAPSADTANSAVDLGPVVLMWPAVLEALKSSSRVAHTLADGAVPLSRTATTLVLAHPDKVRLAILRGNAGHMELLRLAVLDVLHLDVDLDLVLDPDKAASAAAVAAAAPAHPPAAPATPPAPSGPSARERANAVVAEEKANHVEPEEDVVSADDPDAEGDLSGLALVQRELGGTVMTEYDNG